MKNTPTMQANEAAERIVRYFQSNGFAGISEALIIRIRLKVGTRHEIEDTFETAHEQGMPPPLQRYFEITPFGHYSDFRSYGEAKAAIRTDFTEALRLDIPKVYFDRAPVLVDDALASGTKYDALLKLRDNDGGYAVGILLNDPDASFMEYIGTHHGDDWQQIMGNLELTSGAMLNEIALD